MKPHARYKAGLWEIRKWIAPIEGSPFDYGHRYRWFMEIAVGDDLCEVVRLLNDK